MEKAHRLRIPKVTPQILAFEPYLHLPPARRPLFRFNRPHLYFWLIRAYSASIRTCPGGIRPILQSLLSFFCKGLDFRVEFYPVDTSRHTLIHEDRSVYVYSIPLRHRIECCGFLFQEKATLPHIRRDMIDFYRIPICEINNIKNGMDWTTEDGTLVPNHRLTEPSDPPRSFAYCSDTCYLPELAQYIQKADLLFHEATFSHDDLARAKETFHTTALQAATLARDSQVKKLCIGHFSARYEDESQLLKEAQSIFEPTILARENLLIKI